MNGKRASQEELEVWQSNPPLVNKENLEKKISQNIDKYMNMNIATRALLACVENLEKDI